MTGKITALFLALFIACPLTGADMPGAPTGAESITEGILFRNGKNGYKNIRIPALCRTKAGSLLAFAEGREGGDTGNIDLIMRRSEDDGKTWDEIQVVWDDGENTCGSPAPVVDLDTGTIWLFLTWNAGSDTEATILTGKSKSPRVPYVTSSKDDGKTWAKPKAMPHLRQSEWRWYSTGPGNGIQLTRQAHKGRLIIPANHSDKATEKRDTKTFRSHIIYSDDHGETWQLGGLLEPWTNESTAVELADGSVMLNMQSYHGKGIRAVAISKDGGITFGPVHFDERLKTPVCQGNLLRYSWPEESESRILFSSPTGNYRSFFTVFASYDEGKTWPILRMLHLGPSAYSNLVWLPGGRAGVLYEKGTMTSDEMINFVTFGIDWLEAGPNKKSTEEILRDQMKRRQAE